MGRIKTFVNGGSLLPGDLNAIQDDYENAFASWRTIQAESMLAAEDLPANTYILPATADGVNWVQMLSGASENPAATPPPSLPPLIYLDDADYPAGSRAIKLRVRATVSPNATPPGITFTLGLYPVAYAGVADRLAVTLGTVVTGSTAVLASPGASATTKADSSEFTIPADGPYLLGAVTSAQLANNSVAHVTARLQVHQV